jgi:alpha-N-arabinofuranosidase
MGKRIAIFAGLVLSVGGTVAAAAQQAEPGVPERLKVRFDTQQTAAPISKYLYGGFIEHGGTLMYRSLWSEVLDDRKFYFPITSKDTAEPAETRNRPFRMPPRKWRPVGC